MHEAGPKLTKKGDIGKTILYAAITKQKINFKGTHLEIDILIFKDALNDMSTVCLFLYPGVLPSFMAIGPTVAELEHHKINMNTKEKYIIRSILKFLHIRVFSRR